MDNKFEAAVFDMDGVLLDTEKVYRICWKKNGMDIGIPEEKMNIICDRIAGGNRESNGRVFKTMVGEDFEYLPFRAKTMKMFEDYITENGIDIKSGVVKTLEYLKNKGVKIALATSTVRERATDRLEKTGLLQYFDVQVCGDEIKYGKPNPEIYLTACSKLGVSPEKAIGVEDSINGIVAASDAGLYTIMVVDLITPNDITKARAKHIYYNISNICELF